MPTNKQRREAARRHLERQLERREQRSAARKKLTLYASIGGTVLAVAVVIALVLVLGGGNDHKADNPTVSSPTATPPTSAPNSTAAKPATGQSVSFNGVTVKGATDLSGYPVIASKSSTTPKTIEVKDLVVGKGAAAKSTSTVSVHYVGVLYKDGTQFDSSWPTGSPAQFGLTQVVKGFQYGIGGTDAITPMRVGGRRIIIMPPSLGYGDKANGSIPANSALVFVVDLKTVS